MKVIETQVAVIHQSSIVEFCLKLRHSVIVRLSYLSRVQLLLLFQLIKLELLLELLLRPCDTLLLYQSSDFIIRLPNDH